MAVQFNKEEYEKYVIAILILNNQLIDMVKGRLSKECFQNPKNRYVYEKICSQWERDKCVTLVTLTENDKVINAGDLAAITSLEASATYIDSYIDVLNTANIGIKSKKDIGTILENMNPNNINESIERIIDTASSYNVNKSRGYTMNELAYNNTLQVRNAKLKTTAYTGMESGFENLDNIIDGWQPKTMYVIGARPSIGKTAFALAIIKGLAKKGAKCSMFSLEMSGDALYSRMIASESGIPMWQIKKCLMTNSEITKYMNAGNILSELPIYTFDSDIDIDKTLYARIRYEVKFNGAKAIMIDHLGLIEVSDSSGQRYVDVGRITKTLHKMAKELNVPIIVLAQCGREAEGKKPNLALLRESGNIEQDADVIMLLHRKREVTDNSNKDPMEELPTDVIVAKNRDGRTGTVTFSFQPSTMRFREDNNRSVMDDEGNVEYKKDYEEKKNEIPF